MEKKKQQQNVQVFKGSITSNTSSGKIAVIH